MHWLRVLLLLPLMPLLALLGLALVLPGANLGAFAAAQVSARLGREVRIEALHIEPGWHTRIALRGATLANIEGGSEPVMARIGRLDGRLDLAALLGGRIVLHEAELDGFTLLLERAPGRRANWHFGHGERPPPPAESVTAPPPPRDYADLPTILEARIANGAITFRTTGGRALVTRIEQGRIAASAEDQPIAITASGSYNDVPLTLEGTLASAAALRGTDPVPIRLRIASGETVATLEGTATDPLNFDGIEGRLTLEAPSPAVILRIAGEEEPGPRVPIEIAGRFTRHTDLWRLTEIEGRLDRAPFTGALLRLVEGAVGQSNRAALDLAFTRLNLNRLLGAEGEDDAADMPLTVPAMPDPLVEARLRAQTLIVSRFRATDAALTARVEPGRIAADRLELSAFGARFAASAVMRRQARGARIGAEVAMSDADLDALRRALGIGALPIQGTMEGRAAVEAQGTHLDAATRGARLAAVLAMRGGRIAQEVVELASTDVRALFRTARGTVPVECLLTVVRMEAGRGEIAPLRLRTAAGAVSGIAQFDLNRRLVDLVFGTERATTEFWALDIPVRVSGSFANPSIAPAPLSAEGRARLAQATRLVRLPPELAGLAQASPCNSPG
ncbi:MAG TPA: AsmA-like C-terminal region-containing protein [Acetobacteraceae bacterium]|nr:AsmA-like C-terminal region-containing protein [Acetobacteraceae bacterium]